MSVHQDDDMMFHDSFTVINVVHIVLYLAAATGDHPRIPPYFFMLTDFCTMALTITQ